ncbi:malonyl-CoA synthase [Rhizobium sp. XQZ8]|uniref:malonate--CoA ligase n=1 Tax=Rhizobium populisoli TaxID=2859785 RepID=UPI001C6823B8|nr:malonyl-CoA synthase [Rhizobium populisoli]MBW6425300.1 malonyl-CoA synthase [Rhizobium populisoli]
MSENLFSVLKTNFPEDLNKTFLQQPGEPVLTYGGLVERSGQFANAIVALGVKPGDRVAVQVEKSIEAMILYVATVRTGAIYLPLNPAYTISELRYFLGDAEPTLVVCKPESRDGVAELVAALPGCALETLMAGGGSLVEKAAASPGAFTDVPRAADDIAAILYTSGTTGRSKGAMLTHGNLFSNVEALKASWRFSADDVLLHALPIFHTHGLFVATNLTLRSGSSMIYMPSFDADTMLREMPKASVMMGVPTFYSRLLTKPGLTREATAGMRLFISGSAPLSAEVHKEFSARTGHEILERYGMTETNMNTSNLYDGARIPGSVGPALPGVEVRITDLKTGESLPRGEAGGIEIRGPNVFKGYWRMPEKTKEDFREDGFFKSGDVGYMDEDGYVYIAGRSRDLIITGGLNVYPAEVEAALDAIPGVAESAVIGVPHADFGEGVVAVVARRSGAALDEDVIRDALKDQLAKFKQPKKVFIVTDLPRNVMGKIQKNMLREEFAKTFD